MAPFSIPTQRIVCYHANRREQQLACRTYTRQRTIKCCTAHQLINWSTHIYGSGASRVAIIYPRLLSRARVQTSLYDCVFFVQAERGHLAAIRLPSLGRIMISQFANTGLLIAIISEFGQNHGFWLSMCESIVTDQHEIWRFYRFTCCRPTAAAHRADFRARISARKFVSVSVSVSVSVPWKLSFADTARLWQDQPRWNPTVLAAAAPICDELHCPVGVFFIEIQPYHTAPLSTALAEGIGANWL